MIWGLCQANGSGFPKTCPEYTVYQKLKPNCLLWGSKWKSCTVSMSSQCKTSSLRVNVTATADQQILLLAQTSVMCLLIASPRRINKCGTFKFSAFLLWSMADFLLTDGQRSPYQARNRIFATGIPLKWLSLSLYLLQMKNIIISNNKNTVITTELIIMRIAIERLVTITKDCNKL